MINKLFLKNKPDEEKEFMLNTVDEAISFVKDVDMDKPFTEHFMVFHEENRRLIKKLKKLKKHVRRKNV